MKLLADAHISRALVGLLRDLGQDVLHIDEVSPGLEDGEVLAYAHREGRVVITSDKDFGTLVYRSQLSSNGVILLRIDVRHEVERVEVLRKHWGAVEGFQPGSFVVVTTRSVRRADLPVP